MKNPLQETLTRYGEAPLESVTVADLIDPKKYEPGEIWAHVENSGSEGTYVEVARWSRKAAAWRKYAFEKYLGGELDENIRSRESAEIVTNAINAGHDPDAGIVHGLPYWED